MPKTRLSCSLTAAFTLLALGCVAHWGKNLEWCGAYFDCTPEMRADKCQAAIREVRAFEGW
ncbi:MAG TPA: hypothetical protein DD417_13050 [Elusimicrobia bacterium]|nr:hypothetical protein [Elusimicrobiota bacterium]